MGTMQATKKVNCSLKDLVKNLSKGPDFAEETGKFLGQMTSLFARHFIEKEHRDAVKQALWEDYKAGKIRMTQERKDRVAEILISRKEQKVN